MQFSLMRRVFDSSTGVRKARVPGSGSRLIRWGKNGMKPSKLRCGVSPFGASSFCLIRRVSFVMFCGVFEQWSASKCGQLSLQRNRAKMNLWQSTADGIVREGRIFKFENPFLCLALKSRFENLVSVLLAQTHSASYKAFF